MLQQMSSPADAQFGEVTTVARAFEGRFFGDVSSGASSDTAEDFELPHCKIRRNYNCTKCTFYTQNPRAYLVHTRDAHFVKLKIYECPHCIYASRHNQKLVRHVKMVHDNVSTHTVNKVEFESAHTNGISMESESQEQDSERIEDMLEEIEDNDDIQLDMDDCNDDKIDRPCEMDIEAEPFRRDVPVKGKENLFSCDKCNYVTHLRSRFTKHVKYHSMPMIKCVVCDFRTPYKWNLDRHMKNHGGVGSFKCSMCNFTADIKQSLTVHEMNHHTPQAGHSHVNRRRNRVGASDAAQADEASLLLVKEEDGSGDSRSSHSASEMGQQNMEKDMIACNSDSNDTSDVTHKISHSIYNEHSQQSPSSGTEDSKGQRNKKTPRPLPQLIPLNSSTPNQTKTSNEPPTKKIKLESDTDTTEGIRYHADSPDIFMPYTSVKDSESRKKNESFFDKLKKRLLTETGEEGSLICKNCGFQSKCLSEHSVHEKSCTPLASRSMTNTLLPSSGSTRCQNCRHRCKSSADLFIHMQNCGKSNQTQNEYTQDANATNNTAALNRDKDIGPHPMENVVFVWNNINQETNKFDTPLDININDDCTLPDMARHEDIELVDDNDGMNLSPSQAAGKNVFKCPHCSFWASTASRFHVHIVGHLNKKPFECSICKYKSNWRWDITKHIKLKSVRDLDHNEAKVLMTDETGRRNYSKYTKFLAIPVTKEGGKTEFRYLDLHTYVDDSMDVDDTTEEYNETSTYDMQPLNLQTKHFDFQASLDSSDQQDKKPKKTLWKCKKCNYKDSSKDALLEHVREHTKGENPDETRNKKPENSIDPADLAYRCGHCHQLSNWKHVIQRHCRLKHNGIIKVITTVKQKPESNAISTGSLTIDDITSDFCTKCPFKSNDKQVLLLHYQQHEPSTSSVFKCYFCPFFVKNENELVQHLHVHGVDDPEDFISRAMGCRSPVIDPQSGLPQPAGAAKRHKCSECPYETNSKSQYMYHEQFHRLPADTPYKCPECNYSVSKRHLLHQHLRVHGIIPKKNESEAELESMLGQRSDDTCDDMSNYFNEIPLVWVSAKDEFHKMYKCRYCSYVNSQKCKIPVHEKIHCIIFENDASVYYKCSECKFTFDNAVKLSEHSKSHGDLYGRIYCLVTDDIPDDEQVAKLRKVLELEKTGINETSSLHEELGESKEKLLYFCQQCPAHYFTDSELQVHDKNHNANLSIKCKNCSFAVSQDSELILHAVVHSDEYHTKTRMLKFAHNSHPAHRAPILECIRTESGTEIWVINHSKKNEVLEVNTPKKPQEVKHTPKQYNCKECPAKFFKGSALNYHMGLHGGEGEYKCKSCSYAVKNVGNLAKHEALHEKENKNSNGDYESGDDGDYKNIPLSGTDLFQRKTEAQKRVLTDKDKLVKPNDHFPPVLQADPQFGFLMHGNPEFIYPTYLKNGRQKEKRYKCHKCPSAFEKREQYKIHLSLHGSKQRYKCELCDYSVKYYANYVQHMRKHQMNDEAQAERKKGGSGFLGTEPQSAETMNEQECTENPKMAVKTIPKTDFQQFSYRDQQTLRLLQRRRSNSSFNKDISTNESVVNKRKLHSCLLCPYTNHRQDALNNHYKRHDDTEIASIPNAANHKCNYCDLIVLQSHFLKEHLKTHFNYQKTLTPECFVANENVSFTITKADNESQPCDLKLDIENKNLTCNDVKMFVNIKTGELVV